MAKDFSFDVVSDFDAGEMINVIDQAQRELSNRYDFKGTAAKLEFTADKGGVLLEGDTRNQLDAIVDVLRSKLIKRELSPKILDTAGSQPAESGVIVRWTITFKRGLNQDDAKKLTKLIREHYPKAKAQIQGEAIRVSSTSKDDLQGVMNLLRCQDLNFPLQFENYR
jgi:uncharacterized protein YajQ (UPF0234 family)